MNRNANACQGKAANTLARKLKKKYKQAPKTVKLYDATQDNSSGESPKEESPKERSAPTSRKSKESKGPNLHLATKEQLMEELEKRLDEERDAQVEHETDEEEEAMDEHYSWVKGDFPERVVIVSRLK